MTSDGDQRLWAAVIHQAIVDATASTGGGGASEYEIKQARNWFERAGPDFRRACALADLEPEYVRNKALAAIAAHDADKKPARNIKQPLRKIEHARKPSKTYDFEGRKITIHEIAGHLGVSCPAIRYRLNNGWSIEKIMATPASSRNLAYYESLRAAT